MKKIIILCIVILCQLAVQLQAQNKQFKDVVYLNDGSRMTGSVLSYKPNESILLELTTGQQLVFLAKDIKKVVMGMPSIEKTSEPYEFKERGLYNASSLSLTFGKSTFNNTVGIGFQHSIGFQFNRILGAGLGVSYENLYLQNYAEGRMLSIFGEMRGYFSKHNTAFYYNVAGGLAFPVAKATENLTDYKGGLLIYPAFGMRFGASKRYNFFMDIGAKIQQVSYSSINEFQQDFYSVTYRRWVVRGGILF
jgi:sRNA-binding regulator protein Hfq